MYYYVYVVYDVRKGLVSWPWCVEVGTTQWSKFCLSSFGWVVRIKLKLPSLNGKSSFAS